MTKWHSVQEVAQTLDVSSANVLDWIASGELQAVNVAAGRGARPRWRVSPEAVRQFEVARSNRSTQRACVRQQQRTSRRRGGADVIEFF